MNDLEYIISNPKGFTETMKRRGLRFDPSPIVTLYEERKSCLTSLNNLQASKNELTRSFQLIQQDKNELCEKAKVIDKEILRVKEDLQKICEQLELIMLDLPNILAEDVPIGEDESSNVVVKSWGVVRDLGFEPKAHDELGVALGILDFSNVAKVSGARFSGFIGKGARLFRVLKDFMLEHNIEHGHREYFLPYLVKEDAMYKAGQLPKFSQESFRVDGGMRLVPTSEVTLLNFVSDHFFGEAELPLRMTSYSECFRSEAGSSGKDTKGIIRQHQFGKVELLSITEPDKSDEELERMLCIAEGLLQKLKLPYRVVNLCSGDIGFCSKKTYDIEVWIPSQRCYREISSCSNCGDFQSRRLAIKYKFKKKKGFLHTLNASSLAIGRTIVAILENYQMYDGSIEVPEVLRSSFGTDFIR
ncbi:serine--tRNA ligase [Neorickettsia findlayensis]|uniref:Serine--tRNA ligase n=1 Tax=Neorickettsia findlayensis TaxID=2686014 RepID=A0A6P1GBM1_9RICK|nr:serine--tRNA ligase [Neorickettsia findlayensis]QHD65574.1 serine--tRNA ligase [Neorickettsia findlayensis]